MLLHHGRPTLVSVIGILHDAPFAVLLTKRVEPYKGPKSKLRHGLNTVTNVLKLTVLNSSHNKTVFVVTTNCRLRKSKFCDALSSSHENQTAVT